SVCTPSRRSERRESVQTEESETTTRIFSANCNEHEIFSMADMESELTFSGKATCEVYEKTFQFNPDLNAKRGHVLTVSEASGKSYLSFRVYEFTLDDNGTVDKSILRPGDIVGAHTWFAPTTGIWVDFKRDGNNADDEDFEFTFTATISDTPTNHHCPYPFVDLEPNKAIVLEDTLIEYYCDAKITAPPGFDVRIDHIKDTGDDNDLLVKVLDDDRNELEVLESFPVNELLPGANPILLDISNRGKASHQVEIQVSAVELNCTCGPREYIFNSGGTTGPVFFQSPDYPHAHCRMISCATTFSLTTELRSKYKIIVDRFDKLEHGTIEITDGPNGISTLNEIMTRSFTFESPYVTLMYLPSGKRYEDVFSIEVELIERQDGCDCPPQLAIDVQIDFEIPAHCKKVDCMYEVPQFDDNTVNYFIKRDLTNDYIGSRRTGATSDRYSYDSGTGTFEFDSWANRAERMYIRFHRE
ncbi:hypothetical protein PMAYCL1PPCAC_00371, partial [Pristionchus mayeri]